MVLPTCNVLLGRALALVALATLALYILTFQQSTPVNFCPQPVCPAPVAVKTESFCRMVCVKNQKGALMAVNDVALLSSLPLPQCSHVAAHLEEEAYKEWLEKGYCTTYCLKSESGQISEFNGSSSTTPLCRQVEQPNLDFKVDKMDIQSWTRTENLAGGCNNVHGLDRELYHTLDDVGIHLVYFTWLPRNKMARHIIPEQLYDVQRSGLFDRPNTFLHIVASTDQDTEYDWLKELPVVKNHAKTLSRVIKNRYEYPGIRMFWELGCKALSENRTRDLFIYFHAKGTTYNIGRAGVELAITNELVANWRLMLNLIGMLCLLTFCWLISDVFPDFSILFISFQLFYHTILLTTMTLNAEKSLFGEIEAANPSALTFGLGGLGFHWLTFFWARADIFLNAPMPVMTKSRYWYEHWAGFNLAKEFPNIANPSQCHLATGIDSIKELADSDYIPKDEKSLPDDRATRTFENFIPENLNRSGRLPQYSLLRCGMMEVSSPWVQKWFRPVMVRFDTYLKNLGKWSQNAPPK